MDINRHGLKVTLKPGGYGKRTVQKGCMTKEELIKQIGKILKTDLDLNFLVILEKEDIERLIACIRDRVDQIDAG